MHLNLPVLSRCVRLAAAASVLALAPALLSAASSLPHLEPHGSVVQLVVDGRPFLIRGGELGNSTATNPAHLQPLWAKFRELHLNTLVVPAYWDLLEPQEGRFDFATVDQLIAQARANDMHLVLLWFGSWKNSMSCYAPAWVKEDPRRFPRACDRNGVPQEILSPFYPENERTDARAFAALLRHLRETDGAAHTVLMVQVENEIGMLPDARDHSAAANQAFAGPVPPAVLHLLTTRADSIAPGLRATWQRAGGRTTGTWAQVFGGGPAGEEIFMAWWYARYTDAVAAAGKAEYPLPMYVNAALIRPGYQPGQYPSAGPLPHLRDLWEAAAPHIDTLAPDIYFQDFTGWGRRYVRPGRAFFTPESVRGTEASVHALYTYASLNAIGFSPFDVEDMSGAPAKYLSEAYDVVAQLQPLILAHQGTGTMAGLLSEGPEQHLPQEVRLGGYVLSAAFDPTGAPSKVPWVPTMTPPAGGMVIATGPNEFLIAGTGLTVTFASTQPNQRVGIVSAEEGHYVDGHWQNILWLGGDQTNQGRQIRLEGDRISIQRVKLYRY